MSGARARTRAHSHVFPAVAQQSGFQRRTALFLWVSELSDFFAAS
jgi:hypothetical protein